MSKNKIDQDNLNIKDIKLFENLVDYKEYDFHNNYECYEIMYSNSILKLFLRNEEGEIIIEFDNVIISEIHTFGESNIKTIDNLYRGRFERNGELKEFLDDKYGYFYLNFYDGYDMAFWAEKVFFLKINNSPI